MIKGKSKILITGGAGYIGSHVCVELLESDYSVVVVDNLCNSKAKSIERVRDITGMAPVFVDADIRDSSSLNKIFSEHAIDAVIHLAGLKAVGESVTMPIEYYQNNLVGTLSLIDVMKKAGVKNIVFSSSATVYGDPSSLPIKEEFPLSATNPYARCKLMIEEILTDIFASDPSWNVAILRYFNPVGAHKSGKIGEDPKNIPNNLMPHIAQVAIGSRDKLMVYGNDYSTIDGTGVRDYVHVMDLAKGHICALEKLTQLPGLITYNLGTGQGYSVLQMVAALEAAAGKSVPYEIVDRRLGDVAAYYADPTLALKELGWKSEYGLKEMCEDTWNWQTTNPRGYL